MDLYKKLKERKEPIRVSVVGAGEFGVQLITQISYIPNMEIVGVADTNMHNAYKSLLKAGYQEEEICCAENLEQAQQAVLMGKKVAVRNALILCELPADALCDVTGDPPFGALFAYEGLVRKKHVIVVNIESTATVGSVLGRIAKENGVVYTSGDGDQPSLIAGLCEYARCLGMEVEVAGKWTNTNHKDTSDLESRSDIGYWDGSKSAIEMCCVSNITGLVPDEGGMHGVSIPFDKMLSMLDLKENGGILNRLGVVEMAHYLDEEGNYVIPKELTGGVFIIASCENPFFWQTALSKGMITTKDGHRVLIYRQFHFCGIETAMSIIRAVLYGEASGGPLPYPVTDVYAVAKRDMEAGEILDGVGGHMVRGEMELYTPENVANRLPLALAQDVALRVPVLEGTQITMDMVVEPEDSFIWKLYRYQNAVVTLTE